MKVITYTASDLIDMGDAIRFHYPFRAAWKAMGVETRCKGEIGLEEIPAAMNDERALLWAAKREFPSKTTFAWEGIKGDGGRALLCYGAKSRGAVALADNDWGVTVDGTLLNGFRLYAGAVTPMYIRHDTEPVHHGQAVLDGFTRALGKLGVSEQCRLVSNVLERSLASTIKESVFFLYAPPVVRAWQEAQKDLAASNSSLKIRTIDIEMTQDSILEALNCLAETMRGEAATLEARRENATESRAESVAKNVEAAEQRLRSQVQAALAGLGKTVLDLQGVMNQSLDTSAWALLDRF